MRKAAVAARGGGFDEKTVVAATGVGLKGVLMASLPLVSVVVTSYNYGRFLREAVASVQGQSYKNVEIIVVDDGSTDDTAAVARELPVRYVYQRNGGVCRARNHGATLARGELLMFLDADDILRPAYIERCQRALAGAPARVAYVYTQMEYFGDQTGIFTTSPFSLERILLGGFIHASALMKRAVFEQTGGFSLQWTRGHEDMELWVRMFSLGHEGLLLPEPLLLYRRHGRTRNTLTDAEILELDLQLWTAYPQIYWSNLARHPLAWLKYRQR
jgi:glycosyltransferase involved in cell wall biosynthesis